MLGYYCVMSSLLLAESGSTKTDWCLIDSTSPPRYFKTSGINPHLQSAEVIRELLSTETLWNAELPVAESLIFYGAGAGRKEKQTLLSSVLKAHFGAGNVEVHGDLLAAARAMCGNEKGIVSILGTGSNSCYFDGKEIRNQHVSLGFIAGDEGSGNHMGKRVLQYYAYHTFDEELTMSFEQLFGNDLHGIIREMYATPFPNRYLATFVKLLLENRGHFMVENIIEDSLNDFFQTHLLKYRESWKHPLHFTGSVAHEFRDVLAAICHQYELEIGTIEKSPIEKLVRFHANAL